jgi:ComF family protein
VRAALAQGLAPLADLIFPPRCPGCGQALAAQAGLCAECWQDLRQPDGAEDGVIAATFYGPVSRRLVLAFKHGGRVTLAPLLGRMIAARLPDLPGEWLVVPVPLHRWRLWRRGYNQSALLARAVARATGHELVVDALLRQKATPSLGGLGRTARARVLAGAIVPHPRASSMVAGRRVLLVDDVLTSGATTDACRRALLQAGAAEVLVACFARVEEGG